MSDSRMYWEMESSRHGATSDVNESLNEASTSTGRSLPGPVDLTQEGAMYSGEMGPGAAGAARVQKKTRKPYTMNKARECWTEKEHMEFLEAIANYDRDWKKIEEYIGTKTAVQIRSHAQKYFQKCMKNGDANLVPPPRPKRKSNEFQRDGDQKAIKLGQSGGEWGWDWGGARDGGGGAGGGVAGGRSGGRGGGGGRSSRGSSAADKKAQAQQQKNGTASFLEGAFIQLGSSPPGTSSEEGEHMGSSNPRKSLTSSGSGNDGSAGSASKRATSETSHKAVDKMHANSSQRNGLPVGNPAVGNGRRDGTGKKKEKGGGVNAGYRGQGGDMGKSNNFSMFPPPGPVPMMDPSGMYPMYRMPNNMPEGAMPPWYGSMVPPPWMQDGQQMQHPRMTAQGCESHLQEGVRCPRCTDADFFSRSWVQQPQHSRHGIPSPGEGEGVAGLPDGQELFGMGPSHSLPYQNLTLADMVAYDNNQAGFGQQMRPLDANELGYMAPENLSGGKGKEMSALEDLVISWPNTNW